MGVKWEIRRWVDESEDGRFVVWGADLFKGGVLVECNDFAAHAEALEYALRQIEGR